MIEALIIGGIITLVGISGIKIVRPMERGLVERFGKYNKLANPGFNWIIPAVDKLYSVNITKMMVDATPQEIITKDKLNARVDAQVYFKVKSDENSIKASRYNVYDYRTQIVNLARTTLRNIIGTMNLTEANSERDRINGELMKTLAKETTNWGIEVVRTELKEIDPPKEVQITMNKVNMAENEKVAAVDYATASETEADGKRRASIKVAEGLKQAAILEAEGKAKAFALINESFIGNAQILKKLEVTENSLKNNSKFVLTEKGIQPTIVLDESGKYLPIKEK